MAVFRIFTKDRPPIPFDLTIDCTMQQFIFQCRTDGGLLTDHVWLSWDMVGRVLRMDAQTTGQVVPMRPVS